MSHWTNPTCHHITKRHRTQKATREKSALWSSPLESRWIHGHRWTCFRNSNHLKSGQRKSCTKHHSPAVVKIWFGKTSRKFVFAIQKLCFVFPFDHSNKLKLPHSFFGLGEDVPSAPRLRVRPFSPTTMVTDASGDDTRDCKFLWVAVRGGAKIFPKKERHNFEVQLHQVNFCKHMHVKIHEPWFPEPR